MKNYLFIFISLLVIAVSCKGPGTVVKQVPQIPAEMPSDPAQAFLVWKNYIDYKETNQLAVTGEEYYKAADHAKSAGDRAVALQWFESSLSLGYENPMLFDNLAAIYKGQNNLSKELNNLKALAEKYPAYERINGVNERLFEIYLEVDKNQAFSLWNQMTLEARNKESNLDAYFKYSLSSDNQARTDSIADALLKINPRHVASLEWNAIKYYEKAENRYQLEMDKYNRNKTHVQYQFLLNALKVVTADFKKSLTYFDPLWEMDPGSKYAAYMANIYTRLNNQDKADYYKRYLK